MSIEIRNALTPIVVAIVLAGCSTVAARREDPANLVAHSPKSVAEFRACFLRPFERDPWPVMVTPAEHGETYTQGVTSSVGTTVLWVVDVVDQGSQREVTVHGLNAWGRRISRSVNACI